ncbi:uncharacterized protein PHACADRAFT_50953, partial [Phanerochaete carnosa HHB-10118-sp]
LNKTQCVVVDRVTIGHPCCSIHTCHEGLESQRHRFCPMHHHLDNVCTVIGCNRPVAEGCHVCDDPVHLSVEGLHHLCGQSRFSLAE